MLVGGKPAGLVVASTSLEWGRYWKRYNFCPSMSRNKRGNRLFQLRMVLKLRAYLKDSEIFTASISSQSTFEVGNKNCANEKQQCLVVFTFQFGSMKITGEVNKFAGTKDMKKIIAMRKKFWTFWEKNVAENP